MPMAPISLVKPLHQLMLHRVMHQFGVVPHPHFFQNARAIGADGFDAEGKFFGDFADDFAGGDQAQDLELAVGKQFLRRFLGIAGKIGGEFFRERRADVASAGQNFFDRATSSSGALSLVM